MPRPATRTRILSASAAAAVAATALSLVVGPPAEVDPLGAIARANASRPASTAPAAQPSAFGVSGVDLAKLGYAGPELDAVSLASLSTPFSALPTERAADIRDRIARGMPHLQGLHQAKNLLQRALPRQDHHVNAGKVAVAEAEARLVTAREELVAVRARLEARAATTPDEGGPEEAPAPAHEDPGRGTPPSGRPDAAEKAATVPGPKGAPAPKDASVAEGGTGAKGAPGSKGAPASRSDRASTGEKPSKGDKAPNAAGPAFQGVTAPATAPVVPVPVEVPGQSPVEKVGALVVLAKAEATVLDAEDALTGAVADLEARRARRRAFRAAAAAAEHEVWRIDAHLRWLEYEQWLAQGQMPSAGNWLVLEERGDADVPIVKVRGFRVHRALEDSVRQLVDAAAAAGIDLKGSAYRPVSRQIELRRQNCGPTDFDIFQKSPSLCSPPTAKPGRSLHELGLALDLQNGPNSIVSRRDPAFRWLQQHAPSYGLYNLPAEPWHWSITGQ
ncbi:MAG TPA: D-alanyl-D-alanine carboxypeptidase family protein [Acidimicrobiales bacterium]|nr:D-alanyl-D-alanine carboxypeptidase family protein [Acidimicrobiales bacterium]